MTGAETDLPSRGYEGFRGVARENASASVPWWPPSRAARPGAPNVIVILVDDMGFSDISPFGSEIATPAIQALADEGFRFSNYHSTPLCSPSRAALLTGLNPHRAGFGYVAHADPGYPGFQLELADDVPTLAESFRAGGYATFMVGKWHLTKESKMNDAADRSSWPLQRGFDHYYGSMDGFTSLHHPHRLVRDNTAVQRDEYPEGYYLTDDLTDEAIGMINGLRANDATRPFFLYFAHQAVHGPVQAKPEDMARYRGMYDAGWGRIRQERFRRQLESGLFPEGTRAAGSDAEDTLGVPAWESLDPEEQRLFARHMEAYAAAVDAVDQSVARIVALLKERGEYENTIIVVTSDNGATGEGGIEGTRSYFSRFVHLAGLPDDWVTDVPRDPDLIGGPQVHGHYPRGWAHVSNTPFRMYKGHTYAGGVHVPLIVSWPAVLPRAADDPGVRDQYAYVTDIAPTLLSLAGVDRLEERDGHPVTEVDGTGFDHVFGAPDAPSRHRSQYVECGGRRGYFEDGWKIVAPHLPGTGFDDDGWELYEIATDPAETRNRATEKPELVARLAEEWRRAAWRNTVFPLDDTGRMLDVRPSTEAPMSEPVTLLPATPTLERFRSSRLTLMRSFAIEVRVDVHAGGRGVLVAHGDQGGGYVLYLEGDGLRFTYNAYGAVERVSCPIDAVPEGSDVVRVDFDALPGLRWRIRASASGAELFALDDVPQLLGMAPFTGISVGVDAGGPVDWELSRRHGAFRFDGGLRSVRYIPGPVVDENPEIIADIARISAETIE